MPTTDQESNKKKILDKKHNYKSLSFSSICTVFVSIYNSSHCFTDGIDNRSVHRSSLLAPKP
jgi:hypothetical protein